MGLRSIGRSPSDLTAPPVAGEVHRSALLRLAVGMVAAMVTSGGVATRLAATEMHPVAVIWNAPAGCASSKAIADEVERTLGASSKELAPVAAAVTVLAGADGRWRANLVVDSHGKRAERQFEAESCAALATAASLIIALAAEGPDERPLARAAGDRPPPERPDGQTMVATSSSGRATPASAWEGGRPYLLVGALFDGGTMPGSPATGVEAAAGESWTASLWRLRLLAGPTFFLPQQADSNLEPGVTAGHFWLLALSARGCATAALSRFEFGPCLGGEVVGMHGTGIGGTAAHSTQFWASPVAGAVAVGTVVPEAVVFLRAEAVVPNTRRTFLSDPHPVVQEIYRVPTFALRGAVGVELRFF